MLMVRNSGHVLFITGEVFIFFPRYVHPLLTGYKSCIPLCMTLEAVI